jgi:SAM-dependent methyltransferase
VPRDFEDLIAEAAAADVTGWDFGWLAGRATEQRPSWGYQRLLSDRLATVNCAVDLQTGGGEVLDGAERFPRTMVATESYLPNLALAGARLQPRGVAVVAVAEAPPLPFADGVFDLVSCRHPASIWWTEIRRVLRPGGTYLAQHVGPRSVAELYEFFLGPEPDDLHSRHPDRETAEAVAAGLTVETARLERLRMEFFDIGAVVYFLRKVIWTVPDFSVDRFRDRLHDLHQLIEQDGSFVAHSSRVLIEATAPSERSAAVVASPTPRSPRSDGDAPSRPGVSWSNRGDGRH